MQRNAQVGKVQRLAASVRFTSTSPPGDHECRHVGDGVADAVDPAPTGQVQGLIEVARAGWVDGAEVDVGGVEIRATRSTWLPLPRQAPREGTACPPRTRHAAAELHPQQVAVGCIDAHLRARHEAKRTQGDSRAAPVIDTCRVISYDAVVLAGGDARRLGGVDKPMIEIAGRPMLVRVIDAVASAHYRGGRTAPEGAVRRSGPLGQGGSTGRRSGGSARRWNSDRGCAPYTVVLPADLPFVSAAVQPLLQAAASSSGDGALLVDRDGRDQPLAAAYRREGLLRAVTRLGSPTELPMRDLVRSMQLVRVPGDDAAFDCDTGDDVRRAHARAIERIQ